MYRRISQSKESGTTPLPSHEETEHGDKDLPRTSSASPHPCPRVAEQRLFQQIAVTVSSVVLGLVIHLFLFGAGEVAYPAWDVGEHSRPSHEKPAGASARLAKKDQVRGRRYQWLFGQQNREPAHEPASTAILKEFDRQIKQARKLYLGGDSEKAVLKYRSAIDRFESLVDALPAAHPLLPEMEERFGVYEELATKIMGPLGSEPQAAQASQIFYLMEKRRISRRNLTLKKAGVSAFSGVPRQLLDEEARILAELTQLRQAPPSSENRRKQERLKQRLGQVRSTLQRTSTRYALLRRGLPVSLGEVRRDLLRKHEMILDFNLFRERMVVGVITSQRALYYQFSAHRPEISKGVFMLQDKLREFTISGKPSFMGHAWREPARRLYRTLLGNLPPLPEGKTTIFLIPDGSLWYLPISILLDAEDRPFGKDRLVSLIPSADMLKFARSVRRSSKGLKKRTGLLLFESLPWVSEEDARKAFSPNSPPKGKRKRKKEPSEGEKIQRIILKSPVYPKPSEIVRKIQRLFSKFDAWVGQAATASHLLKRESRSADVSVLALPLAVTDAVEGNREPTFFFSPDRKGDRLFRVRRFFEVPLRSRLTILPTAWFDIRAKSTPVGEGPLLLTIAMTYAGSHLCLLNYSNPGWGNDDPFLLDVLKNIAGGMAPEQALKAYQRTMPAGLDSSFSGKPPAWAGWLVVGDPGT